MMLKPLTREVHLGVRVMGTYWLFYVRTPEEEGEPAICLSKNPANKLSGGEPDTHSGSLSVLTKSSISRGKTTAC